MGVICRRGSRGVRRAEQRSAGTVGAGAASPSPVAGKRVNPVILSSDALYRDEESALIVESKLRCRSFGPTEQGLSMTVEMGFSAASSPGQGFDSPVHQHHQNLFEVGGQGELGIDLAIHLDV